MTRQLPRFSPLVLVAALTACAGGGSTSLPNAQKDANAQARATVFISVPRPLTQSGNRLHGHFVSPATRSIAIAIKSKSGHTTSFNANLTPSSNPNCTPKPYPVTCTLTFQIAPDRYTASFATYDGPLVGTKPSGKELSANQNVPFTAVAGADNEIKVTLDGIPKSIAFVPAANSTLSGSPKIGYAVSRCNPTPQDVTVLGVDADGNFILGPGSPTVTLQSGSPSLAVAAPKPATPYLFVLTPQRLAPAGSNVFLEAKATQASGNADTTLVVKFAFSDDICGIFTEFPVPTASSAPWSITVGPDNALWFTEIHGSQIGRIPTTATVADPQITEFKLPTANAGPYGIASGPGGMLWFTECYTSKVGSMPTSGSPVLEFPTTSFPSNPRSIAAGPDGAMWFAETNANKIGRMPTSGTLTMTEYTIPTAASAPSGIVTGPDGALWFTEADGNKIGRIPTTGAPITESLIPTAHAFPRVITEGPDGQLWFTECGKGFVGNVPTSGSPVREHVPPVITDAYGITTGPDGALWFAEQGANMIGRITTNGVITEYTVPTLASNPQFIVAGPDGALWFTERTGNKIGRLQ